MHNFEPEDAEFHKKKKKKKKKKPKHQPQLSGLLNDVIIDMARAQRGPSPGKMAAYAKAAQDVFMSEKRLTKIVSSPMEWECKECEMPVDATAEACPNCGEPRPPELRAQYSEDGPPMPPDLDGSPMPSDLDVPELNDLNSKSTGLSALRLGDSVQPLEASSGLGPHLGNSASKSKKSLNLSSVRTKSELEEDLLKHGVPPGDLATPFGNTKLGGGGKFNRYESDKEIRYSSVGSDLEKKMGNPEAMAHFEARMSLGDIKSPGGADYADTLNLLTITESRGTPLDSESPKAKISIAEISADVMENVYGSAAADDMHLSTTDDLLAPRERRSSFLKTNKVMHEDIERRSVKSSDADKSNDASPILTLNIKPKKDASGDIPASIRILNEPSHPAQKHVSLGEVSSKRDSDVRM